MGVAELVLGDGEEGAARVSYRAQDLAGPLTSEAVVRIFERIIDEARRAERESGFTNEDFGPSSGE